MLAMAERVMRFAQAYPNLFSLAAKGDADAQKVMSAAIKGPVPGSGIETRNDEERALVAELTSAKMTSSEIQAALDQHRAQGQALTTREQRRTRDTVMMSNPLPPAKAGWLLAGLHSKDGVAIPGQIADKLVGRSFKTFDGLRSAIWRLIGQIPELTSGFDDRNLGYLQNGNAPVPPDNQQVTLRSTGDKSDRTWELHHEPPISLGGSVYDLSTIRLVTPKQHDAITYKRKSYDAR